MEIDGVNPVRFGDDVAIRYGDIDGKFDKDAPARIGAFVLGHDINTRLTLLNEQLSGVVMPDPKFWDPENGVADLIVTDTSTGVRLAMTLGSWLVRDKKGRLRPMAHNRVLDTYVPKGVPLTFEEELALLLSKHGRGTASNMSPEILAAFLSSIIRELNATINRRDNLRS